MALAERPGAVLSRQQLLDVVARRPDEVYERVVDVHVANLRRKLGDDPGDAVADRDRAGHRLSPRRPTRTRPRDARPSLAVRLAVAAGRVLVVVLLLAGMVVNRAASRSLEETLGPREQQRLELAVTIVEEALERGVDGRALQALVRRIAAESGGMVRVRRRCRHGLGRGRPPAAGRADRDAVARELSAAAGGGALEISVPTAGAGFMRAFNTALLFTGIVAVAALLIAAAVLANRLTRPLRE